MSQHEQQFQEGDVVLVPLLTSGYAIGVVSRKPSHGEIVLGHFFGPRHAQPPKLDDVTPHLHAHDALVVRLFCDDGLIDGTWTVLGPMPDWNRRFWPMPAFYREEPITGRKWRIRYDDDDLFTPRSEEPINAFPDIWQRDSLSGSVAILHHIENALSKQESLSHSV